MEQHHRQPTAGSTNFYRRTSSGVTSSYYRIRKSKSSIVLCNQVNSLTILCSNWLWVRQSFFTVALDLTRYDNSFFPILSKKNVSCFLKIMPDDGRSISRNAAHLNMLVHDLINLLYYECWTDKQKYFYVYRNVWNSRSSLERYCSILVVSNNAQTTLKLEIGIGQYTKTRMQKKRIEQSGWLLA